MQFAKFSIVVVCCASLLWGLTVEGTIVYAQGIDPYVLTADSLQGSYHGRWLPNQWKYHPGDDTAFAMVEIDDTSWEVVDPRMRAGEPLLPDWEGIGWFRLHLLLDSTLADKTMSIRVEQRGASDVYLDGQLLYSNGVVGASEETTQLFLQRTHQLIPLEAGTHHVLAIRYANYEVERFHEKGHFAGFLAIVLAKPIETLTARIEEVRVVSAFQHFFMGIFAAFAVLHLFLFVFYPQSIENLFFALLISGTVVIAYVFHESALTTSPWFLVIANYYLNTVGILVSCVLLLFVYQTFYGRISRLFYIVGVLGAICLILVWTISNMPGIGFLFLIGACLEMLRVVILAIVRRKPGAWIMGIGMACLAFAFLYVLFLDMGFLSTLGGYASELPFFGMLALTGSMSVYLSRNVARTNRDLRDQLLRVQELSEEKLEHERQLHEQEVERKLLEAEYEQKLHELEEARQLQLSMLPETVPEHPLVELATYMETATEVGGDYYDFQTADDGTLTVAVGDATGHGMKAGTMVTATKTLFNTLSHEGNLLTIFSRSTRALKQMNMRKLYMALTLAKFKDGSLRLATAGMPPTLVYRAVSGAVEAVQLKGMPLGSFVNFPYQEEEVVLAAGDTVLFMSDGFPELFNAEGEMLGYDRAVDHFGEVGNHAPGEIIRHLVDLGKTWANGRPQDDDMTFVVLKVRK